MQATEWTGFKINLNERSGPKSEKKIDRVGHEQKLSISFRTGLGSDRNFNFSFGRAELFFFTSGRAGLRLQPCWPGLKNLARTDLYPMHTLFARPLHKFQVASKYAITITYM